MNYFNRNRLLIGLVILITIINLASLGTILYLQYGQDDEKIVEIPDQRDEKTHPDQRPEPPFRQEEFRSYMDSVRQSFRRQVRGPAREVRMTQSAIMQELMQENPDLQKLDSLAREAGKLHYRIKKNMIDIFMERNQESDSAEREYLRRFYRHFMVDPRDDHRRGHRHRHRGPHHGDGPPWKN